MDTNDKKTKLKKIKKVLLITNLIVLTVLVMFSIRQYYNSKNSVPNNSGYGKDINENVGFIPYFTSMEKE